MRSLERLVRLRFMNYLKRIKCRIVGHNYRVVQRFSGSVRRVKCDCCDADWGMNDNTRSLIDWDNELEEMHGRTVGIKEPKFTHANKSTEPMQAPKTP